MHNSKFPGSAGEKTLQQKFNTTADAHNFYNKQVITFLSPLMIDFIQKQEMMFISTSDSKGECDASFRAGEKGFVMIIDKHRLLYPEYKGNGVMASMGNISENPNIGLMFLDFFKTKVGLHVNGKAKIIEKQELQSFLHDLPHLSQKTHNFKTISYVLVEVEEAYIHCSIHIPMLQKIDEKNYENKFPKNAKGGDAFEVAGEDRPWTENKI